MLAVRIIVGIEIFVPRDQIGRVLNKVVAALLNARCHHDRGVIEAPLSEGIVDGSNAGRAHGLIELPIGRDICAAPFACIGVEHGPEAPFTRLNIPQSPGVARDLPGATGGTDRIATDQLRNIRIITSHFGFSFRRVAVRHDVGRTPRKENKDLFLLHFDAQSGLLKTLTESQYLQFVIAARQAVFLSQAASGKLNAMNCFYNPVTKLGMAHSRYGDMAFGVHLEDRFSHLYVVGQTGTGKSTLLLNMALQDARRLTGFCLIDPHGDLARSLGAALEDDHIYWDVADPNSPFGYNPLTRTSSALRPLIASGLIEALKKQWSDAWGVRMEHLLRYAILALLELPQTDLSDILRLYLDREFRKHVLAHVTDPNVLQFWTKELPAMNYKNAADGLAPIANKLGAFLAHPVIRKAICEPETPLRFRQIMDEGKVVIVNLSKGQLGADVADVLGGLLVSSITHAAFTRHSVPEPERRPFMLYVDEFHSFTTETIADLLSETRKYKLGIILSQQHTQQASASVLASIFGNAGSLICFRIGASDAPALARQLGATNPNDLITQPNYRAFVRLMVNGEQTKAFTMTGMSPPARAI